MYRFIDLKYIIYLTAKRLLSLSINKIVVIHIHGLQHALTYSGQA